MEEVVYWRADDGKIFEDEDECREYEFGLAAEELDGQVFLLDTHFHKLPLSNYHSYTDAYYIFLTEDDTWSDLYDRWPDFDSYFPRELHHAKAGLWVYDDAVDSWYHMGQRIAELQSVTDDCMKVVNGG